ncbi:hypothetical protein ACOSP7_007981 [Xanthoceras sorbifolium]
MEGETETRVMSDMTHLQTARMATSPQKEKSQWTSRESGNISREIASEKSSIQGVKGAGGEDSGINILEVKETIEANNIQHPKLKEKIAKKVKNKSDLPPDFLASTINENFVSSLEKLATMDVDLMGSDMVAPVLHGNNSNSESDLGIIKTHGTLGGVVRDVEKCKKGEEVGHAKPCNSNGPLPPKTSKWKRLAQKGAVVTAKIVEDSGGMKRKGASLEGNRFHFEDIRSDSPHCENLVHQSWSSVANSEAMSKVAAGL